MNKGLKVAEVGKWKYFVWIWGLRWRRERFHWES